MLLAFLVLPAFIAGGAQIAVLTQHNDNARTGANLNEVILNTANVNTQQFGKLFARSVDGHIYAQPLYVGGVDIPGKGSHNVVYVATQHNTVYAFDADDAEANAPLWQVNLGPSAPVPNDDFGNQEGPYQDIKIEVGITSTPVIDLKSETIYVLPFTKENRRYIHRLHALDLNTGQEKFNGPVIIQGSVPGVGAASVNGVVTFDSKQQLQRPALLLSNGVVYFAFGSYGDTDPFHGWVFGYDATTLRQAAIYNTTPDGWQGSVWQSGQGIAADKAGQLYLITGNGSFSNRVDAKGLSNSFIKLNPLETGLKIVDWFTPYNYDALNESDLDLGSTGVMLIPDTNWLIGGDKQGVLYLLDHNNLGRFRPDDNNQIVQSFKAANGNLHGSPVYWKSQDKGPLVYVWGERDKLKAFQVGSNGLQTSPLSSSTMSSPEGMPGGFLSISANGSTPGTGIVWASLPFSGDANKNTRPGILRALDASDVSKELWDSKQNPEDDLGYFAKFCPPTIANGKVYQATFTNQLIVYGLRAKN